MKRISTLLCAFTLPLFVNGQVLLEENFTYSGNLTSNGWVATSAGGTNSIAATGTGLTFTDYAGSGIGNAAVLVTSGEDAKKDYSAAVTTGTVYMTVMLKITGISATTSGGYITGLTSGTTGSNYNLRLFVKPTNAGANIDFGVSRSSGTPVVYTGNTYNLNTTYLITCKYTLGDGAIAFDDVASIYVHPTTGAVATEPAVLSAVYNSTTSGSDAASGGANTGTNAVFLRQISTTESITAVVDGFRVSTSWSETIPVELLDFKAQRENQAVKLLWSTASELNNAYYTIERSENGKSFEKIGEISGYGNSNVKKTYEFMDEKPLSAVNYYRLRQVDFDGKETVYKIVSVHFGKNTTTKVYPSIAKDNINVEISGDNGVSDLHVVNLFGQVVKAQKLQNTDGVFPVNISDLPNGPYILRLVSKNESVSQRFEKQ